MATIPYTTIATKTDDSNILLSTSTVIVPTGASQTSWNNDITNLRTSATHDFSSVHFANFFTGSPPRTTTLNATTIFSVANFVDGVYDITLSSQNNTLADTYTSECFILITTACDAGIAALRATAVLPRDLATLNYLITLRTQVDTYYVAADYTNADLVITHILLILAHPTVTDIVSTMAQAESINTLFSAKENFLVTIVTTIPNTGFESWLTILSNTNLEIDYDWSDADFPIGVPDVYRDTTDSVQLQLGTLKDGVWSNYLSWIATDTGITRQSTSFALVTTNLDCVILKLIDKNPNCKLLFNKIQELMTIRLMIDIAFNAEVPQYKECNILFRKAAQIIASANCLNCNCQ